MDACEDGKQDDPGANGEPSGERDGAKDHGSIEVGLDVTHGRCRVDC